MSKINLRDENGLLIGLNYPRNTEGSINWRAMLKPEHLYVNPEFEEEIKTRFNVKSRKDIDVTKVEDRQLLITLAGINYLARLRGIKSITPNNLFVTPTEVTSVCTVEFIPNFENPDGLIIGAQASASLYSVSGQFQLYLATFAQNRAFVRAVKQALGIEILGKDEVDFVAAKKFKESLNSGENPLEQVLKPKEKEESKLVDITPNQHLRTVCNELSKKGSHSFEKIKEQSVANKDSFESDPNDWADWDSIPRRDVWTLLSKVKDAAEKKKKE